MKLPQRLLKVLQKYYYSQEKYQYFSHILKEWDLNFVRRITEIIANGLLIFGSIPCFLISYQYFNGIFLIYRDIPIFIISSGLFCWLVANWYIFLRQGWREK